MKLKYVALLLSAASVQLIAQEIKPVWVQHINGVVNVADADKLPILVKPSGEVVAAPGGVLLDGREPIAQFTTWQKSSPDATLRPVMFYLDEEGYVLTPTDVPELSAQMAEHFQYLPRLMGVDGREIRKGGAVV
jgi:hypothetical protein